MITRQLTDHIRKVAQQMPVLSITGPRQSGKTTLCRALFPDYLYANLEHPETRAFALEDPKGFLAQREGGMVIDEAQYAPELFSYVQATVDETRRNGEFVLSGSQNFLFMEKISQSLAGRVAIFHLLPFGLQELRDTPYFPERPFQFVLQGGYPRLYDQGVDLEVFFPAYVQTYVERDVRQLVNVGDLQQFQLFVRLCAGRIGQLFNQSALASEVGISQPTVKRWLSLLETSFIAFTLSPYYRDFNKRLTKTPKLYFHDTGLACYLLGIREEAELMTHYARGALFENFAVVELMKQAYHRGQRPQAYFWRDKTGMEIDLILDQGSTMYPYEIKSGQTLQPHFFDHLRYFQQLADVAAEHSTLIYVGDQNQRRSHARVMSWDQVQRPG